MMKKCTRCKQEKPLSDFNFKVKSLGIYHNQCRECTRLWVKNHYNSNREYYLDKTRTRNKAIRLELQAYITEYFLNNHCVDCGERDIRVLEFDHQGKISKLDSVSSLIRARVPLIKVKEEIAKCEVRCANCHRKRTSGQFKWFRNNNALVA